MLRYPLAVMLSLLFLTSAFAEPVGEEDEAVQKIADPLLDNVIEALNEGNFEKYVRDFDDTARGATEEAGFLRAKKQMETLFGKYQSRTYLGFLNRGKQTIVLYKGRYSESEDDLMLKIVLTREDDRILISGVWLQ